MKKIKKGDQVIVLSGKDKGRTGTVLSILKNSKVLVENVNIVKKHQKGNPNTGQEGGIIEKEMPVHISNVMLFCLLYTSPSPRDGLLSRMPSSA